MTSRDLYTLLHMLNELDSELQANEPAHLAVIILKIAVERRLTERKEFG